MGGREGRRWEGERVGEETWREGTEIEGVGGDGVKKTSSSPLQIHLYISKAERKESECSSSKASVIE